MFILQIEILMDEKERDSIEDLFIEFIYSTDVQTKILRLND